MYNGGILNQMFYCSYPCIYSRMHQKVSVFRPLCPTDIFCHPKKQTHSDWDNFYSCAVHSRYRECWTSHSKYFPTIDLKSTDQITCIWTLVYFIVVVYWYSMFFHNRRDFFGGKKQNGS